MKTIKEWFEETLPKEVAELSIQTTLDLSGEERLFSKAPSFKRALLGAFFWMKSPQEDDFWRTIYESNGTIIPELPKNE